MKKLFLIFMSLVLICSNLYVNAAANNSFTAELIFNKDANVYTVSGTLSGSKGNVPMLLTVKDPNGNFYTGMQTFSVRNGDKVTFSFDGLSFPFDATTGRYSLYVTSEFFDQSKEFPVDVLSISGQWQFLKDLNNLILAGGDGVYDLVKDNSQYLGLKSEAFNLDDASVNVYNTFITVTYDVPNELSADNQNAIAKVQQSWKLCCDDTFKALAAASFVDIENSQQTDEWFNEYYTELGFGVEDQVTAYSEEKINNYLNKVRSTDAFAKRISNVTDVNSMAILKNTVDEIILLTAIETMQYTAVNDIVTSFPQLFLINNTVYNKLSSEQLGTVFSKMAGKSYGSYQAAADDFDYIAEDVLNNSFDDNGGYSGGGSGGSVFFGNGNNSNNQLNDMPSSDSQQGNLIDLFEAEWARQAITHLVSKNIVNGRGNGKFDPNDNITRAEFIKIVVTALGLPLENSDNPFADVNKDAWYCGAVASAKKSGIIFGDNNNLFAPNDYISRQDMAVILYRAFKFDKTDLNVDVYDFDKISDYAKDGVATLYKKGIINGMGDGSFTPLSNATRAQAAQMIYKIIK